MAEILGQLFGERLTLLLNERKMTQKELALKAGVTEAAVSHYVKGDRVPRSVVLARLAEVLHTTTDYLMGGKEPKSEEEIEQAKDVIYRYAFQMSNEQKMEIVKILFGDD